MFSFGVAERSEAVAGRRACDLVPLHHALRAWHIVSDFENRCELGKIKAPRFYLNIMLVAIIVGIITVIVGVAMVWKPRFFVDFVGHQEWAEKVFGVHEDETAFKVIGIIVILIGAFIMTGIITDLLMWFFAPTFRAAENLKK